MQMLVPYFMYNLQNCESNKHFFFISFPALGIPLEQCQMDQDRVLKESLTDRRAAAHLGSLGADSAIVSESFLEASPLTLISV